MSNLAVGLVGYGEAASCFASGLNAAGVNDIVVYCHGGRNRPPYSDEFRARVASVGGRTVDTLEALLQNRDVVFSAVLVESAERVGREIARSVRPGQLVVDINASTPRVKNAVAEAVEAAGGSYVDANLMGAVSIYGHGVQLYSSGSGAQRFHDLFTPLGLNIDVAGDEAGVAATVKMLRSVVTKGMEALIVEAMTAAQRAGITQEAFHGICDPMDATTYSDFAIMCIKTDVLHAGRRAVEMKEAIEGLRELSIEPIMTAATARRLRASADLGLRDRFVDSPPKTYEEVLEEYDAVTRERDGPGVS